MLNNLVMMHIHVRGIHPLDTHNYYIHVRIVALLQDYIQYAPQKRVTFYIIMTVLPNVRLVLTVSLVAMCVLNGLYGLTVGFVRVQLHWDSQSC